MTYYTNRHACTDTHPHPHTHTHAHQILVRVHEQFELFINEDQYKTDHQLLMGVLKTLAKIGPRADPVFRDECQYLDYMCST